MFEGVPWEPPASGDRVSSSSELLHGKYLKREGFSEGDEGVKTNDPSEGLES